MLRALIFDFDGLIIDTESAIYQSWRELYASHGQVLTIERWSQCVGTDFSSVYDPKKELEQLTGLTFDWGQVEQTLTERVHQMLVGYDALPGVRERLQEARELGLPCSIASSSPLSWVSKHVESLGLRDYFANISTRDHVERIKPHPDLFLDAAAKLNVGTDEVIIFEDSLNGLKAARAAGIRCVVVPGPTTRHLDFSGAWQHLPSLDSTTVSAFCFNAIMNVPLPLSERYVRFREEVFGGLEETPLLTWGGAMPELQLQSLWFSGAFGRGVHRRGRRAGAGPGLWRVERGGWAGLHRLLGSDQ